MKIRALSIVAHPDDETIWMGGMILSHEEWEWTVFSLCRKEDKDRMPKFKDVCSHYKAKCIISDLEDDLLEPLPLSMVTGRIKKGLLSTDYDYIFTHGSNGEYGHIRHKEVHEAVKQMVKEGSLVCKRLYYFSYETGKGKKSGKAGKEEVRKGSLDIPLPSKDADFSFSLGKTLYGEKVGIITLRYGFKPDSFEASSCSRKEAFVFS